MELFNTYILSELIESRKKEIERYVTSLSNDEIMSGQDETIVNNMYEKYRFELVEIQDEMVENRRIQQTKIEMYNRGTMYPDTPETFFIDGVKVTLTYPFIGDKILLQSRGSTYTLSGNPNVELYENHLTISIDELLETLNREDGKAILDNKSKRVSNKIKELVGYCNKDAENFNNFLKSYARGQVNIRKDKVSQFYNIAKTLEIPLVQSNPKIIEMMKTTRKIVPLHNNSASNEPEYAINDNDYEEILRLIKHQGSTFERTPDVYKSFPEEQLRDIILSQLNGVFEGNATGECFRKKGKTDILIERENRAAFIAECKVWKGKRSLQFALAQLQSYTTWRDNKLCLIFFSRNKDFFNVLEEIKSALPLEENYINLEEKDKNEFELKLKSKNNDSQILKIRVFAFDLYIEKVE